MPACGMQLWYVFLALSLLISCLLPYWRFCFLSAFALVLREVRSPALTSVEIAVVLAVVVARIHLSFLHCFPAAGWVAFHVALHFCFEGNGYAPVIVKC